MTWSKQLPVRLLAVVGRKAEKAQPLPLQTRRTTLPLVRVNFSQPCHDEIGPISMRSVQVFADLFAELFAALFRGMVALS